MLYVNVEVCAHLPPDWECSDERQGSYIFNLRSSYSGGEQVGTKWTGMSR